TQPIIGGLIASAPSLIGWTIAVILASIMLRRGAVKSERFLLAGASLMLLESLLSIAASVFYLRLVTSSSGSVDTAASMLSIFGLIRGFIKLAGIICIVYAFWVKFKERTKQ
ncbi:MAG: hypothetical protein NTZ34_06430, partial [Chloroflexi bacterium]|nr:hypothetical protein [Chloroflexota bacterium]